jgi:hypothetical protein
MITSTSVQADIDFRELTQNFLPWEVNLSLRVPLGVPVGPPTLEVVVVVGGGGLPLLPPGWHLHTLVELPIRL